MNHEIKNPANFTTEVRKFEISDRAHADVLNQPMNDLINNDVYLKNKVEVLESSAGNAMAENISIQDTKNHFVSGNVEGALSECFQFANDGKSNIATAINSKGVLANNADTFPALADKITNGLINKSEKGIDTTDATANEGDLLSGRTAYARGMKLNGTMPNYGAVTGTLQAQGSVYTVPAGYHNGGGNVTANISNLSSENVKKGVNVGGVVGSYKETFKFDIIKTNAVDSSPTTTIGFSWVSYGNGTWIASGTGGGQYSTDGINWYKAIRNDGKTAYLGTTGVCFGNGMWVTLGGLYSTDGRVWTPTSSFRGHSLSLLAVCYANGLWVGTASGAYSDDIFLYYSTDGIYWNAGSCTRETDGSVSTYMSIDRLVCINGRWIAANNSYNPWATSNDGRVWTRPNSEFDFGTIVQFKGVWYHSYNHQSYRGISKTTDGIKWSDAGASSPMSGDLCTFYTQDSNTLLVNGNTVFSGEDPVYGTMDGATWTEQSVHAGAIYYGGGMWLVRNYQGLGIEYTNNLDGYWIRDNNYVDKYSESNLRGERLFMLMEFDYIL